MNSANITPIFHVSRLQEQTPNEVVFGSSFPLENKKDTNSSSIDTYRKIEDYIYNASNIKQDCDDYDFCCDVDGKSAIIDSSTCTPKKIFDSRSDVSIHRDVITIDTNRTTETIDNTCKEIAARKSIVRGFLCDQSTQFGEKAGIHGNEGKVFGGTCNLGENGTNAVIDGVRNVVHDDSRDYVGVDGYYDSPELSISDRHFYELNNGGTQIRSLDLHTIVNPRNRKLMKNIWIIDNGEGDEVTENELYDSGDRMKIITPPNAHHETTENNHYHNQGFVDQDFAERKVDDDDDDDAMKISDDETEKVNRKHYHARRNFFSFKRKKFWVEMNRNTLSSIIGLTLITTLQL